MQPNLCVNFLSDVSEDEIEIPQIEDNFEVQVNDSMVFYKLQNNDPITIDMVNKVNQNNEIEVIFGLSRRKWQFSPR